jgi:hypothetical protein
LDFLGRELFLANTPILGVGFVWISLDFSRPNRDFSMVTQDNRTKLFIGG